MSPALFALPPLPPARARGAEQLRLPPAGAFAALAFVPPLRARELCRRLPPARARGAEQLAPAAPVLPPKPARSRPKPTQKRAPPAKRRMGRGFARSMGTGPLTAAELAERDRINRSPRLLRVLDARPRTRAECADVPRPCPYVSCRHNLYLDETHGGAVKLLFPGRPPEKMPPAWSCTLDIAERFEVKGASFPQIAKALHVSMQRAEQIAKQGIAKLADHPDGTALLEALADVIAARAAREKP